MLFIYLPEFSLDKTIDSRRISVEQHFTSKSCKAFLKCNLNFLTALRQQLPHISHVIETTQQVNHMNHFHLPAVTCEMWRLLNWIINGKNLGVSLTLRFGFGWRKLRKFLMKVRLFDCHGERVEIVKLMPADDKEDYFCLTWKLPVWLSAGCFIMLG